MHTWHDALHNEKQQPYFQNILNIVQQERNNGITIFPPKNDVFNAFKVTEFDRVKVVILGQDPYHNVGQAHGLAFPYRTISKKSRHHSSIFITNCLTIFPISTFLHMAA